MAYNNGIVLVADEMHMSRTENGSPGIFWLKGMQIVNGGQTTASLYFTKKKLPETDLRHVRIPAKIIVLRTSDPAMEEGLIADISKYANSQNAVKLSDLSANKPFHVKVEQLSLATYCPMAPAVGSMSVLPAATTPCSHAMETLRPALRN